MPESQIKSVKETFDSVCKFLESPTIQRFFVLEECYGFVISKLLQGDSYASGIIHSAETEHIGWVLSDTILYSCLQKLESSGVVETYLHRNTGERGRPRKYYKLRDEYRSKVQEIAQKWEQYLAANKAG